MAADLVEKRLKSVSIFTQRGVLTERHLIQEDGDVQKFFK